MLRIWCCALTAVMVSGALACSDDSEPGPAGLSFATDIHPLFVEKCGDCHAMEEDDYPGHGAADVEAAYESTMNANSDGDFYYERILLRVRGEDTNGMMPPSFSAPPCMGELDTTGCLTTEEVELIEQWIDDGTLP